MSEPQAASQSNPSADQPSPRPLPDSAFEDFWKQFSVFGRVFHQDIDRWFFEHLWWFLFGIPLVLLLTTIIIPLINVLANTPEQFGQFVHDLLPFMLGLVTTYWQFSSGVLALALVIILFNNWRRRIPTIFQDLLSKQQLHSITGTAKQEVLQAEQEELSKKDPHSDKGKAKKAKDMGASQDRDVSLREAYYFYLKDYEKKLMSNTRYLWVVGTGILFLGVFLLTGRLIALHSAMLQQQTAKNAAPLSGLYGEWAEVALNILFYIGSPITMLIIGYFFALGIRILIITGKSLSDLTRHFTFRIQPSHPDHCGGLKELGNFALGLAYPIHILALLLSYFILIGYQPIYYLGRISSTCLLVVLLIAALVAFYFPLWGIHQNMARERKAYEEDYANRSAKFEGIIRASADIDETPVKKESLEQAKIAREQLDLLHTIHPDKMKYPVWPIESGISIRFFTPLIPTVLGLLAGLKDPLTAFLQHLLSL